MPKSITSYKGYLLFTTSLGVEIKNEKVFSTDHRPVAQDMQHAMEMIDEDVFLHYLTECEDL